MVKIFKTKFSELELKWSTLSISLFQLLTFCRFTYGTKLLVGFASICIRICIG